MPCMAQALGPAAVWPVPLLNFLGLQAVFLADGYWPETYGPDLGQILMGLDLNYSFWDGPGF